MARRVTEPPEDEVGRRLYFVRLALNFTDQKAFARELGVEPQTYNAYEKGKRRPTQNPLDRLWARHHVPPEFIREGADERLPKGIWDKMNAVGAFGPLPVLTLMPKKDNSQTAKK